jgi:D-glycero-beta-D-manno-heptose 1-phosphate adenylyltransferase
MFNLSKEALEFLRNNDGKKIVFTNGCFDILHVGHVKYLNNARSLGDVLFLGLNSDASVRGLKGEERPINKQVDRKYILENLSCVDFVEIFEEETPLELIKSVKPHFLVKGGDWKPTDIVGHEVVSASGGEVLSLNFVEGKSTTNIINSIKSK